jgi:hypothetical protein
MLRIERRSNQLFLIWEIFDNNLAIFSAPRYTAMLQSVLSTPYFYFSYTLDLSHTRQRLDKLKSTTDFWQVGRSWISIGVQVKMVYWTHNIRTGSLF